MKIFILCGGFGTRLDHEGKLKAKPMVKIGNKPILIHIVENFVSQGFNEFVFCLGHKSETIINYFLKEKKNNCKIIKNSKKHVRFIYKSNSLKFNGDLIYTGIETGTGGRMLKSYRILNMKSDFIMTYGDGLSNINIKKLINFHKIHKKVATVTAVRPPARFGELKLKKNLVSNFDEKNQINSGWINGGFFVFNKEIFKFLPKKNTMLERQTMKKLTNKKELLAFKHNGFWQCMDTMRDKQLLNNYWKKNKSLW